MRQTLPLTLAVTATLLLILKRRWHAAASLDRKRHHVDWPLAEDETAALSRARLPEYWDAP